MKNRFFNEQRLIFKQNQSPGEGFLGLPEKATKERLKELRKSLENFDKNTDKVSDIDKKLESAEKQEKTLLEQTETRFKLYLTQISQLEKTQLNSEQKLLLESVKKIIKELGLDISEYKSGEKNTEFKSEYLETSEYFEKEGFDFLVQEWFCPLYVDKMVPFEGGDEFFTPQEKQRLIIMFSWFPLDEIGALAKNTKKDFFIKGNQVDIDSLEQFLTNYRNPKIRDACHSSLSVNGFFDYLVVKMALMKPNALIQYAEYLSKDQLETFFSRMYYYKAQDLFFVDDTSVVLDIATIFISEEGRNKKGLISVLHKHSSYNTNESLKQFVDSNTELLVKKETSVNDIIKEELDLVKTESAIADFITEFRKDPIKGIYLGTSEYRKNGILINNIVFMVDEDLNIDYQETEDLVWGETSYIYKLLKKKGFKNIKDIHTYASDIKEAKRKIETRSSLKKIGRYIERHARDLHFFADDNSITLYKYLGSGFSERAAVGITFDFETEKITRISPEIKELFIEGGITTIQQTVDELTNYEFLRKIIHIIESKEEKTYKQAEEAKEKERKITAKCNEFVNMLNNKFEIFNFKLNVQHNYNVYGKGYALYVKSEMFRLEFPLVFNGSQLAFRKMNLFAGISTSTQHGERVLHYSSQKLGDEFVEKFESKLKTTDDFITHHAEIEEWLRSVQVSFQEEKAEWEKECENEKTLLMREEDLLEKQFLDIGYSGTYVQFEESAYFDMRDGDGYFLVKVGFIHDRQKISLGTVKYKDGQLMYSVSNKPVASREEFTNNVADKIDSIKDKFLVRDFFEKDFYFLKNIFSVEITEKELKPALEKGIESFLSLLIDFYLGKKGRKFKGSLDLLDFLFRPQYFDKVSENQKKKLLKGLDGNIKRFNETKDHEEKIILKTSITSSVDHLANILRMRDENRRKIVKEYMGKQINCCGEEINEIILGKILHLILDPDFVVPKEVKKELLIMLYDRLDEFTDEERGRIYSFMSDVRTLRFVPPEIQEEIITKTLDVVRSSSDKKTTQNAFDKLGQLIYYEDFSRFHDEIIEIMFGFFEEKDSFEINKNKEISFETMAEIESQVTYSFVSMVMTLSSRAPGDSKYVDRLLKIIKSDKRIGGLINQILVSKERWIENQHLKDYVDNEIENILPKSPNYDEILKDGKITYRINFLSQPFFEQWQAQILGKPTLGKVNKKGYLVTKVANGEGKELYLYQKTLNGVEIELQIVKPSLKKQGFENNVFDMINNEEIDGIVYFGHAGGGNELAQSINSAPKGERNIDLYKQVFFAACSSMSYYAPDVKYLFPKAHFFGNRRMTRGNDDAYALDTLIRGMTKRKTYKEMREDLYKRYEILNYTNSGRDHDEGNLMWPDERENLRFRDTDRDGIMDDQDRRFNIDLSEEQVFEEIRFDIAGASELPTRNLRSVKSFLNGRFIGSLEAFGDIRFPRKERNIGWFNKYEGEFAERLGREDIGDELVKISNVHTEQNMYGEDVHYFELEISAAYKYCSDRVLKALVAYELTDYFLKNYEVQDGAPVKREEPLEALEGDDKYKPFLKGLDNMMHEYHSASPTRKDEIRPTLEAIYLQMRSKYNISSEINFETAYQWSWAKKWFGNTEAWEGDELLQPFFDRYEDYMKKLGDLNLMKNDPHYQKYLELRGKGKDKHTIAQYLACEELMKKVEALF